MHRLALLLPFLFFGPAAWAQEQSEISPSTALKAIAVFGNEPLSKQGRAMSAAIATFADESDDVSISIDIGLYPWISSEPEEKYNQQLLTAILAGNIRSQLETDTNRDDSYSAMLFLFRTYKKIRKQDKDFRIAKIDEQISSHEKGKLHNYIQKNRYKAKASTEAQ